MNLEKTSLVLKKINRLYELIQSLGEVNHTEKDLLKAYILDLYEAVVLSDEDEKLEDVEIDEMKEKMKKLKKQEKKLKKELENKMEKAESISDDKYEEEEEEEDVLEEVMEQVEEASPAEPEEEEEEEEEEEPESLSEEMKQLFDIKDSPELSDRLANAPIADLTRAMGINEKIFTVNELFDGNKEEMDNILLALNGLTDFEEAKSVLARSVAPKYNWLEKQRAKKARNFIRLVRRRYIA